MGFARDARSLDERQHVSTGIRLEASLRWAGAARHTTAIRHVRRSLWRYALAGIYHGPFHRCWDSFVPLVNCHRQNYPGNQFCLFSLHQSGFPSLLHSLRVD
jgi:hypothetical protein